MEGREFLPIKEIAEIYKWPEKSVYKNIERGRLPFRRLGGRILISIVDLNDFLHRLPGCSVDEALKANGQPSDESAG
jgi:excisionase family DNA binding protein